MMMMMNADVVLHHTEQYLAERSMSLFTLNIFFPQKKFLPIVNCCNVG